LSLATFIQPLRGLATLEPPGSIPKHTVRSRELSPLLLIF
jgi:hypothetical protein